MLMVSTVFFFGAMFQVRSLCFILITLHATHFAKSFSTNSSNLGKCVFVLSSPFALMTPRHPYWADGIT